MKKFLAILMGCLLFGMVSQANALSIGDPFYLGHINDGVPANEAAEVGYINDLITLLPGAGPTTLGTETYDRIGSTLAGPFDSPVLTGFGGTNDSNTFDATGFQYILGKYDASNAGSLVWYDPDGFDGEVTLPTHYFGGQWGLSHITAFNQVPEPATMFLLGTGLVFLAGFGRKKFKS